MAERPTYRDLQENLAALGEEVALLRARIAAALDALAMTGYATKDEMESAVRRALTGDAS